MIDMSKEYLSNGLPVRLLCVDGPDNMYPIMGIVEGNYDTDRWTEGGGFLNSCGPDPRDLVEVTA